MKAKYDTIEFELDKSTIQAFFDYAITVMDNMREHEPESAHCWNVAALWMEDLDPRFSYGGSVDDLYIPDNKPHQIIHHGKPIPDPNTKKKARRK